MCSTTRENYLVLPNENEQTKKLMRQSLEMPSMKKIDTRKTQLRAQVLSLNKIWLTIDLDSLSFSFAYHCEQWRQRNAKTDNLIELRIVFDWMEMCVRVCVYVKPKIDIRTF